MSDFTGMAKRAGLGLAASAVDFPVNLGALGDGVYSFYATAEDPSGNRSSQSGAIQVTVDITAPTIDSLDLDPASDTGTLGDQTTENAIVTLVGTTEPGAVVSLVGSAGSTTADSSGAFLFAGR